MSRQQQIIDQLINNLEKALKAKLIVRDPGKLLEDSKIVDKSKGCIPGNFTVEENWIALSCYISIPGILVRLFDLLNFQKRIIDINTSILTPIETFYYMLISQREVAENAVRIIIENDTSAKNSDSEFVTVEELMNIELKKIADEAIMLEKLRKLLVGRIREFKE